MLKIGLILNYQNYKQTILCCVNLIKAGVDRVTIIDNNSSNDSVSQLQAAFDQNKQVSVLTTNANLGYARGNNVGLRAIEHKYGLAEDHVLFVVNPDSLVSSENIEQITEFCLKHTDAGTVTVLQRPDQKVSWHNLTKKRALLYNSRIISKIARLFGRGEAKPYQTSQVDTERIKVDVNSGAFFGIRQTVFNKVGYFDSATFLYYEEQALTFKLQAKGYQNYLLLTSSYVHQGQGSTQLTTRKVLGYYQQSRPYLLTQYLHAGKMALLFYDWTIKLEDFLKGDHVSEKQ